MTQENYNAEEETEELIRVGKLPKPLRLAAMLEKTMQGPLHGKAADCLREMYEALQYYEAQPQQEPLEYWNAVEGWVKINEVREHFDSVGCGTIYKTAGEDRVPVYTSPPQRTWVGLTHDEDDECACKADAEAERKHTQQWALLYRRAIEAKLKEKNT